MRRSRGEGSVYQRKDGLWVARYEVAGKRKTSTGRLNGRGRTARRWLRTRTPTARRATMPARRQRGGSSNWLLGLVRLSLLSRHHSTVGLSPKRHGKRYEERFSTEMFAHTSDLRGRGIAPEDVKVEGNPTGLPGALDRDVRAAQEIHRGHREGRIEPPTA
jgi:hypothetical protein